MGIADFYNKTVDIQRLQTTTGSKKAFTDVHIDIPCHIQPLEGELTEASPYIIGKDYQMYCGVIEVYEGDRVIDGTDIYKVIAVETLDYPMQNNHVELIIRIGES